MSSYGAGGGIFVESGAPYSPDARLSLANTIVAGNSTGNFEDPGNPVPGDIAGPISASNGHNIFGTAVDGAAAGDRGGVDPVLVFASLDPTSGGGRLAFNGGPTPTAALRDALDNPALSGGKPAAAGEVDQRRFGRPLPGRSNPDVGAFELDQGSIPTTPSARNDVVTGTAGGDNLIGRAGADLLRGLATPSRAVSATTCCAAATARTPPPTARQGRPWPRASRPAPPPPAVSAATGLSGSRTCKAARRTTT